MDPQIDVDYTGAIHKRRLLIGGGRGAPSKPMKGDEYMYLVSDLPKML